MRSFSRTLLDLYDDYAHALEANLEAALATSSEDAFHDLRVAIKRTRALFQLVRSIDPEFAATDASRELRTLFRPAGAVRDLQVQLELIAAIAGEHEGIETAPFVAELLDAEHEALARFALQAALFDRSELQRFRKQIARSLRSVTEEVGRIVADAALASDLRTIAGWPAGESLHELRIVAKRAHHSLYMMRQAFPSFAPGEPLVRRIDALQKHLGTWHDVEVVLHQYERHVSRVADPGATKPLQDVLTKQKTKEAARVSRALRNARMAKLRRGGGDDGGPANPDPSRQH